MKGVLPLVVPVCFHVRHQLTFKFILLVISRCTSMYLIKIWFQTLKINECILDLFLRKHKCSVAWTCCLSSGSVHVEEGGDPQWTWAPSIDLLCRMWVLQGEKGQREQSRRSCRNMISSFFLYTPCLKMDVLNWQRFCSVWSKFVLLCDSGQGCS